MTPTTIPTTGEHTPAGGGAGTSRPPSWHRDPLQRFALRYWDGEQWTEHVVNAERQVGIDVGWARAARERAAASPSGADAADTRPTTAPAATPSPSAVTTPAIDEAAPVTPVEVAVAIGSGSPVTAAPADAEPPPTPSRRAPLPPSERFDTSPEAVLGRSPRPGVAHVAAAPGVPAGAAATTAPTLGPGARADVEEREPRDLGAPVRRIFAALGRIPRAITSGWVATGFAAVAIVAVIAMGLAWASSARSYRAQESWERRSDVWEERAGEHADERDEAIAQVGQTRHRNQTLVDDISELEDQIEGLAATNASLQDENQLLREALADLGYTVSR